MLMDFYSYIKEATSGEMVRASKEEEIQLKAFEHTLISSLSFCTYYKLDIVNLNERE